MPPSWRPAPGYDLAVEQARGALRDAMGGLKNLDQLLRSVRVGPKALAIVIPDVRAGCMTMHRSLDTLLGALSGKLSGRCGAVEQLREFAVPRLEGLIELLGAEGPVHARTRLSLESGVGGCLEDLDSVRGLLDLLISAAWGVAVRLELSDVVHQAFQLGEPTNSGDRRELTATVTPPGGPIELLVNASAVVALLSLAVSVVAGDSNKTVPHIRIHDEPGVARGLVVSAQPGPGNRLTLTRQRIIEPTKPCIEEAAEVVGATLTHDTAQGSLSLIWSAAH